MSTGNEFFVHEESPLTMLTQRTDSLASSTIRIAIIDYSRIEQDILAERLSHFSQVSVVCATPFDCYSHGMIIDHSPDVVLIDISKHFDQAMELICHLKTHTPHTRILALTKDDEEFRTELVHVAGFFGCIKKSSSPYEILAAIQQILGGYVVLNHCMFHRLLNHTLIPTAQQIRCNTNRLTEREVDVFRLIGKGHTTAEIADLLTLSIKTVETHRHKIKMRLQLRNSCELAREAVCWVTQNTRGVDKSEPSVIGSQP